MALKGGPEGVPQRVSQAAFNWVTSLPPRALLKTANSAISTERRMKGEPPLEPRMRPPRLVVVVSVKVATAVPSIQWTTWVPPLPSGV